MVRTPRSRFKDNQDRVMGDQENGNCTEHRWEFDCNKCNEAGCLFSTAVPSKKRYDHRLIFSLQKHRYQERAVPRPAFHNWGLTYTYLLSKADLNSLAMGG